MQIITQSQLRRAIQALAETDALIAKEMGYLPQNRNTNYLTSLEAHAAKLGKMIREAQHG